MIITLTSGLLLGLTAGVAPGPLLTLVIAQSLRHGTREGIKVSLAPVVTDLPIILAAFWLVSRLQGMTWPLGVLSLAGAAYIFRLGWGSLTIIPRQAQARPASPESLKKGVVVNFLNPHPYLFWLTVGVPMLLKMWSQAVWLPFLWVAGFYIMLVGSKIVLAFVAGRSRGLLSSRGYIWCNRALGLSLLVFAALLAADGIRLLQ